MTLNNGIIKFCRQYSGFVRNLKKAEELSGTSMDEQLKKIHVLNSAALMLGGARDYLNRLGSNYGELIELLTEENNDLEKIIDKTAENIKNLRDEGKVA